jgi:hypothetical protein
VQNQQKEIWSILWFIFLCRKHEWILKRSSLKRLQRFFLGNHKILSREAYYPEALRLLGLPQKRGLSEYRDELIKNELLRRTYVGAIEQGKTQRKYKLYEDRFSSEANIVNYYALIRDLEPNLVVETGVAAGSMTSWVLAALEANGKGRLISIDIPSVEGQLTMDMTVGKGETGFLIPPEYHHRWDYVPGDAKVMLPKVLAENRADVFIHDSLHTRTHMLFEYNVARCLMRPNTVIMSDDILWNASYFSFLRVHRMAGLGCISNPNLGLTTNAFDDYELKVGTDIVHL